MEPPDRVNTNSLLQMACSEHLEGSVISISTLSCLRKLLQLQYVSVPLKLKEGPMSQNLIRALHCMALYAKQK